MFNLLKVNSTLVQNFNLSQNLAKYILKNKMILACTAPVRYPSCVQIPVLFRFAHFCPIPSRSVPVPLHCTGDQNPPILVSNH